MEHKANTKSEGVRRLHFFEAFFEKMKTEDGTSLGVFVGTEAAEDNDMPYRTVCSQRRPVNIRNLSLVASKIGVRQGRRDL